MIKIRSSAGINKRPTVFMKVVINLIIPQIVIKSNDNDNEIRTTMKANGERNRDEEQRYFDKLAKPARKYIKIMQNKLGAHAVKYLDLTKSYDSGAGYLLFAVNDDKYAIDLRIAEVEHVDPTNTDHEDNAYLKLQQKIEEGEVDGDIKEDPLLYEIIVSTKDGKRDYEGYNEALVHVKSKIDELLKAELPEHIWKGIID
jgi:hypothetical protein